ncbi:UDP-N-acetylmuramoyl-tripeptide--D-alanyl-D-alanine ligase [Roseovarius confluentis]|uniref:UDP-N-acetylmuramoyl-tripeptide--D-alanyl-D- alanine ligase n=1 Tax=Roseovarius confluentis TaxID=1852027 RepID=UPI001475CE89|nr:UDP-N-acetylmuramoyl-tripeptide--D-alanyl-D-alanine ligase [Roseovarius confluentis]
MPDWILSKVASILPDSAWVHVENEQRVVSGISTYFPTYRPGDIVFLRTGEMAFGITQETLARENVRPRLVVVSGEVPAAFEAEAILKVPDPMTALMRMAKDARGRITAPVVAITGSSGKTSTTDLTAHALRAFGPVYATRESGNRPRGVAWNLGCASERDRFVVLELAIGGMADNSKLARPDVAVFTNIQLAHVLYHQNLRTIAERKARIFDGMRRGAPVILNSGMHEGAYLQKVARKKGLEVIHYGRRAQDHVVLLGFDARRGVATIGVDDRRLQLAQCLRHGPHMLENFMATCAVYHALGLPLDQLAERFASFRVTSGRGEVHRLPVQSGACVLLNHSYNANPASMRAALIHLRNTPTQGRRIAVLGAMAELGDVSAQEHAKLVAYLGQLKLDRIYTLGPEFEGIDKLSGHQALDGPEDLLNILESEVRADDVVMVKGSNATGLNRVVTTLLNEYTCETSADVPSGADATYARVQAGN